MIVPSTLSVAEDEGMVEVCVELTFVPGFDVSGNIVTSDGTGEEGT